MCGIAGFLTDTPSHAAVGLAMAQAIRTRGPDAQDAWASDDGRVVLAHARLSIIDLSEAGAQPMRSPCGRYTLVFNGEIYNHLDLRAELARVDGHWPWRGHSDTETLLAAIRHWGLEGTLERLNGMFAFAVFDAQDRTLSLARDRMGEKPLYYGWNNGRFFFASELKALRAHPEFRGEIERDALTLYLRHNYIPDPFSIYKGIHKLPAAHSLTVTEDCARALIPDCYWKLAEVAEAGTAQPLSDPAAVVDDLEALLTDAVSRRMLADVPLGAFLSGGFDSSLVVALMQKTSAQPVKTFSIGFGEAIYNEAHHAKAVATHLGTDHTELYMSPEEAMAVIPDLPTFYDEPFADSSQIPTLLVSRLARQHVTVALSGDGGDELFCGYNRYDLGYRIWRKLSRLPGPLRQLAAGTMKALPAPLLDGVQPLLPRRLRMSNLSDRILKLAEVMQDNSGDEFYRQLISHWKKPEEVVLGASEPDTILSRSDWMPKLADARDRMMFADMVTYLPGDILAKVDRASMAVSLESRVPLLDHRVVEFAWRIPVAMKVAEDQPKWPLRQVLYRHVPRELMERPKMGFGVPIEYWLSGPLRDWAEDLLSEDRLRRSGYFDPAPIRKLWEEHLSGRRRWHYYLWDILMFEAWLDASGHR